MADKDVKTNITVLGFEDMVGAENMLTNLETWEEKGYFAVKDAVVVIARFGFEQCGDQADCQEGRQMVTWRRRNWFSCRSIAGRADRRFGGWCDGRRDQRGSQGFGHRRQVHPQRQ